MALYIGKQRTIRGENKMVWEDLEMITQIKMDLPNSEYPLWNDLKVAVKIECNAFRSELTQQARCAACPRSLCDQKKGLQKN